MSPGEAVMETHRRDVYVVRFFASAFGELHCRVTEPRSHEQWTIADPAALLQLLAGEPATRRVPTPTALE
jgi:hypothetical protein